MLGPVFWSGREVASSLTTSPGAGVSAPLFHEPLYAITELSSETFNRDDFQKLLVRVCPGTLSGITKFSEHEAD